MGSEKLLHYFNGDELAANVWQGKYAQEGEEKGLDYEALIGLHDRLLAQDPPHSSPMEHCCICVTDEDYNKSFKGEEKGWFRNYKGFKSYRQIIEESK